MTFEELASFRETARRGGFSAAARALALSQSAVSRQVQRVEAEFGTPLLQRGGAAVHPTRAGLLVLDFADRVLELREEVRRQVRAAAGGAALLEIAASSAPAAALVPGLVAGFRRTAAGVDVRLHVMNSAAVEATVAGGLCDVGFLGRPPRSRQLRSAVVGRDRIVLAMAEAHPLAGRPRVGLEALAGHELVLREEGSGTRHAVEAALLRAGRSLPPGRGRLVVDTAAAVLAHVRAGDGVGFLSLEQCRGVPGVTWAEVDGLELSRDLFMVYDPRRVAPELERFLAYVGSRSVGR